LLLLKPNELEKTYKELKAEPRKKSPFFIAAIIVFILCAIAWGFFSEIGQRLACRGPKPGKPLKSSVQKNLPSIRLPDPVPGKDFAPKDLGILELDSAFKRGVACLEAKDYPNAVTFFKQVYEKKPDYPTLAMLYGFVLRESGKNEQALAVWLSVPKSEKYNFLNFNIAGVLFELERYPEALKYFQEAIKELGRHDQRYWIARGWAIGAVADNTSLDAFKKAVFDFADIVDNEIQNLQEYTVLPGTKYEIDHLSRTSDIIARALPAFVLLYQVSARALKPEKINKVKELAELTFRPHNVATACKAAIRAGRTLTGPAHGVVDVDEEYYLRFLEHCSRALNVANRLRTLTPPTSDLDIDTIGEMKTMLEDIENHNDTLGNRLLADMAMLLRSFYIEATVIRNLKTGRFRISYDWVIPDQEGLSELSIDSPEFLFGKREIKLAGEISYAFSEEVFLDPSVNLSGTPVHLKIVARDLEGNCCQAHYYPTMVRVAQPLD